MAHYLQKLMSACSQAMSHQRTKIPRHAIALLWLVACGSWLISCSFSRPAAPAGSKGLPAYLLKFVPYSKNNALMGYFSVADAATNQVAAAGQLRIQIYTFTGLTMGNSGSTVRWKKIAYDNTFVIGVSNFHWESYGNFFTVKDLACHFMVPYEHFQTPVRRGKVVTVQIDFRADGGTNEISSQQNVSLY